MEGSFPAGKKKKKKKTVSNILVMSSTCVWVDTDGGKEVIWLRKTFVLLSVKH